MAGEGRRRMQGIISPGSHLLDAQQDQILNVKFSQRDGLKTRSLYPHKLMHIVLVALFSSTV